MPELENIIPVFKNSPVASLILNPNSLGFTILYVNNAFLSATNSKTEDILGKEIHAVFSTIPAIDAASNKPVIINALDQAVQFREPRKISLVRHDTTSGNTGKVIVRYWQVDSYPILDENEQVQFLIFSPMDLTDRFAAVENDPGNLINKNLQHPLFNDYPDAIFTLDLEGNFLSFNKVAMALAECTREELLNLTFIPFIDPEDLEMVIDRSKKTIKGELQSFEARILSARGYRRILNITNLPIISNQEVIGIYLIAKDITPLRNAEKQLQANSRRNIAILENINDSFLAVDRDWTITYLNKETDNNVKNAGETSVGKNLWKLYPEAATRKFFTEYHKAMAENISVRFKEFLPSANLWFEVAAYPSEDGLFIYFKDITKRIQMEAELRVAKTGYQHLFNFNPLPQWVFDRETLRFLDVNEAAVNHYGYSVDEFLMMTIKDIRPEEDFDLLDNIIDNQIKPGHQQTCVVRHTKKSGEIIFVKTKAAPISFGNHLARIVIAADITENLRAEQSLKVSEQRFKALVQEGSDLISILDATAKYLYVSPTCKAVLGIEPEFFIGKNAIDFIHDDDKLIISNYLALFGTCKRVKLPVFRLITANGEYRWIETVMTDMTDDLAVGGIVSNSRDVTQRIKHEITLKESMERYDILSKATSDAVYDWDFLSNKITWNKGLRKIFGHQPNGPASLDRWNNLIHPEDEKRVISDVQFHIENNKSRWKHEYRFRCADDTYKVVLDRGFLLYSNEGKPVRMIGAIQNITDRVNYIQAIEEQNKRFHEISYMQSHVVRAPLARIMGLSSLLIDDEDPDTHKELLKYLRNAADELDQIIREIIQKSENMIQY
ncbi:MAG: PAS domain S-box protein [Sphingobacteriaceae bacterium]